MYEDYLLILVGSLFVGILFGRVTKQTRGSATMSIEAREGKVMAIGAQAETPEAALGMINNGIEFVTGCEEIDSKEKKDYVV